MSCRFSWRSKWNHSRFTGRVAAVLLQKAHQNSASQPTLRSLTVTKHPSFTILVCFWITYTLCVCVCVCVWVWVCVNKWKDLLTQTVYFQHWARPPVWRWASQRWFPAWDLGWNCQVAQKTGPVEPASWIPNAPTDASLHAAWVRQWAILQTPQPEVTWWHNGQFCRHHNQVTWWHNGQFCAHHIQRLHGDTMGSFADTTTRGYMVTQWAVLQTSQPEVTWWHNGQFCRHHNQRLHGDTMGSSADTRTGLYCKTMGNFADTTTRGYMVTQ